MVRRLNEDRGSGAITLRDLTRIIRSNMIITVIDRSNDTWITDDNDDKEEYFSDFMKKYPQYADTRVLSLSPNSARKLTIVIDA